MTKAQVKQWMQNGREIEFVYNGKHYSLCPFLTEKKEKWISFCEFYQETLDVPNVETLWNETYKNIKVSLIFESVLVSEVDIF